MTNRKSTDLSLKEQFPQTEKQNRLMKFNYALFPPILKKSFLPLSLQTGCKPQFIIMMYGIINPP